LIINNIEGFALLQANPVFFDLKQNLKGFFDFFNIDLGIDCYT